jgi:dienelactone hydrolase
MIVKKIVVRTPRLPRLAAGALLLVPVIALAQAPDASGTAKKALDLFLGGKYAELNQMIAPSMQENLTPANLAKLAGGIKAWGDVKSIGQPSVNDMGLVQVVTIPVEFTSRTIDFRFPVNAESKIAQIYMLPGQTAWQRADYVKPSAFQTKEVTVGTDEWKLPGTLTIPMEKRPCAAIVLVADSGPSDRDASAFALKAFRDLAEGLSSRGIAVLRFEKRTKYYMTKLREASFTIDDEETHDALAAVALLRSQPEIDGKRVYIAGLGLGGFIAPRIAQEDPKLAGLILLNAPAKPLEDWLLEAAQSMGAAGRQLEAVKEQATKVKRLDAGDADAPTLFNLPATYWVDLKGYDPSAEAKKLSMPILVLQGGRDFQVVPAEFELWKTALGSKRGVVLKELPALNHYFVTGEGKSTESEYRKPGHVAPEALDEIVKFVNP